MALVDNFQGLLAKELTRKQFLGILGMAVGSILGFSHIIKLLSGKSLGDHAGSRVGLSNTPSSSYGGLKETGTASSKIG